MVSEEPGKSQSRIQTSHSDLTDSEGSRLEAMRYRDLLLQVDRFLRFGTRGTSTEALERQAKEFQLRLLELGARYEPRKVAKLLEKLRSLQGTRP